MIGAGAATAEPVVETCLPTGKNRATAEADSSSLLDSVDREVCEAVLIALRFADELAATIADGTSDARTYVRRMRVRLPLPACAAAIQILAVILKQAREARDAHAAGKPFASRDARTDVDFTINRITGRIERRIQDRLDRDNDARGDSRHTATAGLWGVVVRNLTVTIERAQASLFGMRASTV
jgi:hypothetical protein